jgi:simple sugar transport system ATP-binding protein
MLGKKIEEIYQKKEVPIGDVVLELKDFSESENRVKNINLYVKRGEIAGIAGLVGAGKTELCKTIFGAYRSTSGTVLLNGRNVNPKSPIEAVKCGLAFVPEERRKEGLLIDDPVYANITISALDKFLNKLCFVVKNRQTAAAKAMINTLGIKTPSEYQQAACLSGGNQQKIVVGKWCIADAEVYIFDEPTKGVDVGAKHDIFKLIEDLATQGKGIIYATCEFSEILSITDRTYIMFDGEIVKEVKSQSTDEKELLYYSTGGK